MVEERAMHSDALDCFVAAIISFKQAAPAFFYFFNCKRKNKKIYIPSYLKKTTNRWSEQ